MVVLGFYVHRGISRRRADAIMSLEKSGNTGSNEQGQGAGGSHEATGVLGDLSGGRSGGHGGRAHGSGVGGSEGGRAGDGAAAGGAASDTSGAVVGGRVCGSGVKGGRSACRRSGGWFGDLRGQGAGDAIRSSASNEIHAVGAAPRLALDVAGAVVASLARVTGVVRAACLGGLGVVAVHGVVVGEAGVVAGTASLGTGGTSSANTLGGLVAILTTLNTEQFASRHLHELGLGFVRLQLRGGGLSSERENREGGD